MEAFLLLVGLALVLPASSQDECVRNVDETVSMGLDQMKAAFEISVEAISTTYELIIRDNYPAEVHHIVTSDGYVLELHRIPGSPSYPPRQGKQVAILQHGIFDSSATWVLMGVGHGLGLILADLDYDVWLSNARGNRYSRSHVKYDPDGIRESRKRYWNFSFHEMGVTDLPAIIDYITEVTGQHRMHYIGHSQGTNMYFVMMSEKPEYNNRIISAHMLAPVAFIGHLRSPFALGAAKYLEELESVTSTLGIYEFLPSTKVMTILGKVACNDDSIFQPMCSSFLFLLGGFDFAQLNETMLPSIFGHTPAGASTKQVLHFGQLVRSGSFHQFDYGSNRNTMFYGSPSPPKYNLSNVRAPTIVYYAKNDWLSEPRDVKELHRQMIHALPMVAINAPRFNHFDYVWGIDVKNQVYETLLQLMRKYE